MAEPILCRLCGKRRAKRACPAVQGDICSICCGEQREVTLSCPLECAFLREAHKHEKAVEVPKEDIWNREVAISEDFISTNEELLLFCIYALVQAALQTPGAVDTDVLASLEALIQTQRTAESGLIYETKPVNLLAFAVQKIFAEALRSYEDEQQNSLLVTAPADSSIFKTLVFLHRMGQQNLNGRPRGRMYIDLLRSMTPETGVEERAPSIIL